MNRNVVGRERLLALRDLQEPGEPDLVAEIVEMFRADGNARLARARGALARTDAAALRLEAHSLRGSAGVIGADVLSDAALDVERCATGGDLRTAGPLVDTMARAVADVLVELAAFAGVVDAGGGAGPGPRPADGARP
jgi:HPt (histidine-containing phosphotransfer) domain-containing protein